MFNVSVSPPAAGGRTHQRRVGSSESKLECNSRLLSEVMGAEREDDCASVHREVLTCVATASYWPHTARFSLICGSDLLSTKEILCITIPPTPTDCVLATGARNAGARAEQICVSERTRAATFKSPHLAEPCSIKQTVMDVQYDCLFCLAVGDG